VKKHENNPCDARTASCVVRSLGVPVSDLVSNFGVEIPGVVDGSVLTESIGTAIGRGQFARVPILNGITHDEEMIFVDALGITVSGGTDVPVPERPVTTANYQANIASVQACRTRGPQRSRPNTRPAPTPRRTWPSARSFRTRTSRARPCHWTAGPPAASRRTRTSSTTTTRQ
jgi:hypothetical protein